MSKKSNKTFPESKIRMSAESQDKNKKEVSTLEIEKIKGESKPDREITKKGCDCKYWGIRITIVSVLIAIIVLAIVYRS